MTSSVGVERALTPVAIGNFFTTARVIADPKINAPRFSPTICNEKRGAAAVQYVTAVVFDHDEGPEPSIIAGAQSMVRGYVYSSPGHDLGRPRSRSVLLPSRPMTPAEFKRVRRWLAIGLEANGVKVEHGAAASPAHVWAVPSIGSSDAEFESYCLRGSPVDVDAILALMPAEPEYVPTPVRFLHPPGVLERARRYVASMPGAISGSGGHAATFAAAQALVQGFCVGEEEALSILVEEFNPRCSPPWSLKELRHKIRSASARSRRSPGYLLADRGTR
ncbi:MAG: hypothetical protein U0169_02035 [Polyangiaceae bacterium]